LCCAEFFVNGKYDYSKFEGETGKIDLLKSDYLAELAGNYPIISLKMETDEKMGMDGKCLPIKLRCAVSLVMICSH
jgi:enolase